MLKRSVIKLEKTNKKCALLGVFRGDINKWEFKINSSEMIWTCLTQVSYDAIQENSFYVGGWLRKDKRQAKDDMYGSSNNIYKEV